MASVAEVGTILGAIIIIIATVLYATHLFLKYIERKYQIRVGSIRPFCISDISYASHNSWGQYHRVGVGKIHLQFRRPSENQRTWITLTINDLQIVLSSIKLFTGPQRNLHRRQPSLIATVQKKAWWSSVSIVKYAITKISAIHFQFLLSGLANYVDLQVDSVDVSVEDLGRLVLQEVVIGMVLFADIDSGSKEVTNNQFIRAFSEPECHSIRNRMHVFSKKQLNINLSCSSLTIHDMGSTQKTTSKTSIAHSDNASTVTPAVKLPYSSVVKVYCNLSPACTSLTSFEIAVTLSDVILNVDSILRLSTIFLNNSSKDRTTNPKSMRKVVEQKSFTKSVLWDSPIVRKIRANRRKKTLPELVNGASIGLNNLIIHYNDIAWDAKSSSYIGVEMRFSGITSSLKRLDLLPESPRAVSSPGLSLLADDFPQVLSFEISLGFNDIRLNAKHHTGIMRIMEVDSLTTKFNIKKPHEESGNDDPNSFCILGRIDILSPTCILDITHLDILLGLFDALHSKKIPERQSLQALETQKFCESAPLVQEPLSYEHCKPIRSIPKVIFTLNIQKPAFRIINIDADIGTDAASNNSSLNLITDSICLEINGDYTELSLLPRVRRERTTSRRYVKGWSPPPFTLMYNLIASFKMNDTRLFTPSTNLIINSSVEMNIFISALGTVEIFKTTLHNLLYEHCLEPESMQSDMSIVVDGCEILLCDEHKFAVITSSLAVFGNLSSGKQDKNTRKTLTNQQEPPQVISHGSLALLETMQCHFSISSIQIRIIGTDDYVDKMTSRGLDVCVETIIVDFRGSRSSIDPTFQCKECLDFELDIGDETNQEETGGRAKVIIKNVAVVPIICFGIVSLKDTTPLINIPAIESLVGITLDVGSPSCKVIVRTETTVKELSIVYSLLYHYSCLVGVAPLLHLLRDFQMQRHVENSPKTESSNESLSTQLKTEFTINHINVTAMLPDDCKFFARFNDIKYKYTPEHDNGCRIKHIGMFGRCPTEPYLWDQLVNVENFCAVLTELSSDNLKQVIRMEARTINVRIPCKYVFADASESVVGTIKSIKQLHERLLEGKQSFPLEAEEEGPKELFTCQLKVGIFTFQIDDDPFEGRLSLNWKIGRTEQRARLEREVAFDAKVAAIKNQEMQKRLRKAEAANDEFDRTYSSPDSLRDTDSDNATEPEIIQPKRSRLAFRPVPSPHAKISIEQARTTLDEYNAKNWIKKIKTACVAQTSTSYSGFSKLVDDTLPIQTMEISSHPPLLKVTIAKLFLTVSKPSFSLDELPRYMHKVGKGLPLDTKFTLLVPMHLNCKLKEAWVEIRDYPLPLTHIPKVSRADDCKSYSFILDGDLVIAEELRGPEAVRKTSVEIIPAQFNQSGKNYASIIPRTCSPVKLYSSLHVNVNSCLPFIIAWTPSIQPALLDVARVFESFTKPNPDPSDIIGFWDKIRLMLHIQISIDFEGTGSLQFLSKGTWDPYNITGRGSGFSLCWRKGVKIRLGHENDAGEFLQIDSEEFALAIPDLMRIITKGDLLPSNYTHKNRKDKNNESKYSDNLSDDMSDSCHTNYLKVIGKLGGGVRYGMGGHFHRKSCDTASGFCHKCFGSNQCWSKESIPHYHVITRMPEYAISHDGSTYDSFKGFRSDYVHLSFSVICPLTSVHPYDAKSESTTLLRNSIHLSPEALQHAFAWLSLFDSAISTPIRQGPLFPTQEAPSPKLVDHLQTIKYKVCLSPLSLGMFYKHQAFNEQADGRTQFLGFKGKIDQFTIDLHQRVQEKIIEADEQQVESKEMVLHEAEMDFKDLDLRCIVVRYTEDDIDFCECKEDESEKQEDAFGKDEDFVLYKEDDEWIDLDDYMEIGWILPEALPRVQTFSLLKCPQLMYYKQMVKEDKVKSMQVDQETHVCLMGRGRETKEIQMHLLNQRLNQIELEIAKQQANHACIEDKIMLDPGNLDLNDELKEKTELLRVLSDKKKLIVEYSRLLSCEGGVPKSFPRNRNYGVDDGLDSDEMDEDDRREFDFPLWADSPGHFSHRFVVHNAQLVWNNSVRNVTYKFWDLIEQYRGITYYMSMSAVKFIRDLQKSQKHGTTSPLQMPSTPGCDDSGFDAHQAAQLLKKLVGEEETNFVVPNEEQIVEKDDLGKDYRRPSQKPDDIPDGYSLWKNYIIQLINPQINFRSDKDLSASIILSCERAQLKSFQILDDRLKGDFTNEVVKTKTIFGLDNAQFFTVFKKQFQSDLSRMLAANNYGSESDHNWPVWLPVEAFLWSERSLYPFQQIVKRTSATMQYDKFNHLRIKDSQLDDAYHVNRPTYLKNDETAKRMDSWLINFPKFKFSATSDQYCVFYNVVSDLLMYREPAMKKRADKLDTILYTADLDDLTGAAEMVATLQENIRQLEELKHQLLLNSNTSGEDSFKKLLEVNAELLESQEELYLLMEAITASQNQKEKFDGNTALKLIAAANEVEWIMQLDDNEPFCEWGLANAHFVWMTKEDHSSANTLEVDSMRVINRLKNPIFAELIRPYITDQKRVPNFSRQKILRVYWRETDPIAGIAVVEHFEINLFPLKFQMQYDVGKQLMLYIFPEKRKTEYTSSANSTMQSVPSTLGSMSTKNGLLDHDALAHRQNSTPIQSRRNSEESTEAVGKLPKIIKDDGVSVNETVVSSESETLVASEDGTVSMTSTVMTQHTSSNKRSKVQSNTVTDYSVTDELELMRTRATNNKTFVYIKIPDVVCNISYQGAKETNLTDFYDCVFKMQTLEYRGRTWSWLDFFEQLKKDVIRSILRNTGELINAKLRRPKPNTDPGSSATGNTNDSMSSDPINATDELLLGQDSMSGAEEASDKGSVISNESLEKKQTRIHILKKSKNETREVGAKHARRISNSTMVSQLSSSTKSTSSSTSQKQPRDDAELEAKGKLLLGKLFRHSPS
ncbi:11754_t:CDS:2 [Paraglomus brasilianum]|uniref:11754_t:CDS:1 n=1 Tax=Paraglomus brasilianum TaxID=144538 RepID=A0A9N8Z5Z6_9GLOM|nr:11754_t:CDS:2 [Paraglomus brasilianum]